MLTNLTDEAASRCTLGDIQSNFIDNSPTNTYLNLGPFKFLSSHPFSYVRLVKSKFFFQRQQLQPTNIPNKIQFGGDNSNDSRTGSNDQNTKTPDIHA